LKLRHINDKPYTRTGDIVIAVNPYQWHDHLYTEQKRNHYSNRLVWETSDCDPRTTLEPHVYEVSALSYKGLAFEGEDQSILVSGESGAGKTETVKICLNHVANVQRGRTPKNTSTNNELDPVVQRVVNSNPLLEAFGNAKTLRNDNSSRFGKYLQLQFDKDSKSTRCGLVGSKCEVYLLEKNRVVDHDPEERTFHIFYQLLAAPDSEKRKFWKGLRGTTNESFSYIGYTETDKIEGCSDANRFRETLFMSVLEKQISQKVN
jgi:myosin-5